MSAIAQLKQTFKSNYELAILEFRDGGIVATYPELDGFFEVIPWGEWETALRFRALPATHHPDGAKYLAESEAGTFSPDNAEGVTIMPFLIPWANK